MSNLERYKVNVLKRTRRKTKEEGEKNADLVRYSGFLRNCQLSSLKLLAIIIIIVDIISSLVG